MDAATFALGQMWPDYVAGMRTNQALLLQQMARCRLPGAERERWLAAPIASVLVFTDDACQDSVSALPPLLAIAEVARFELRLLRRSQHADLQRRLSGLAWPPVPMFFFYDAFWVEQGRFVEMPKAFRRLLDDPEEAAWLRDKDAYAEAWWETEFAELGAVAGWAAGAHAQSDGPAGSAPGAY